MIVNRIIPKVRSLHAAVRRNYGASTVLMQKAGDPIQQLFIDKIHEYSKKSKYVNIPYTILFQVLPEEWIFVQCLAMCVT